MEIKPNFENVKPLFKHLSQEELEQAEIDYHNFMSAQGAGRDILDEHEYFGQDFYEEDNNNLSCI